ncbi:MAG: hypothetical protein ACYC9O_05340 [Candidatus Latescibacterota bacterium]
MTVHRGIVLTGLIFSLVCYSGKPGTALARINAGDVQKKYPDSRYIVRSGGGGSPEQAAEAARLEIAKYFEAKISGETLVREWAKSATSHGKSVEAHMTEISNTVIVGASRDIPGIEIVASDGDRNQYEAWAALEKAKYAQVLLERVSGLDAAADRRFANPGDSDLKRAASFSKSMRDLISREKARQDLVLLGQNPPSRNAMLNAAMSTLDSIVSEALEVGLVFGGEIDERIKSALLKGVIDAGIRVKQHSDAQTAGSAGSDLLTTVSCEVRPRKTSQILGGKEYVFFWSDWVLSVKAIDPSTGKVLNTTVLSDKVSGGSEEQASERMVGKILKDQMPKVTSWVYGVIFSPESE